MPVVSDTSPLLNLAIIERLSLLPKQFGEIYVPPAVLRELRLDEALPGCQAVRDALKAGWLRVSELENLSLVRVLRQDLDAGESAAIALALQLDAQRVLLDESGKVVA